MPSRPSTLRQYPSDAGSSWLYSHFFHRMLSHADVGSLTIPLGLYPSNDEPVDEIKQILEIISKKPISEKSDYKHYDS